MPASTVPRYGKDEFENGLAHRTVFSATYGIYSCYKGYTGGEDMLFFKFECLLNERLFVKDKRIHMNLIKHLMQRALRCVPNMQIRQDCVL